jgi:hypothetical protein
VSLKTLKAREWKRFECSKSWVRHRIINIFSDLLSVVETSKLGTQILEYLF